MPIWFSSPDAWIALGTLIALEIVLGIDNIIFISILVSRLPDRQQDFGRRTGIALAMIARLALLFSIAWVMRLTEPLFVFIGHEISGRDLILIVGGLFLLGKSTQEIHHSMEVINPESPQHSGKSKLLIILAQITLLDVVFSLDSVITAVGMVDHISLMVTAIIVSVAIMLAASKPISSFVEQNPTIKILSLSFLLLIGFTLIGEGLDVHVPKGYIYFAMAFSCGVELLNIKMRKKRERTTLVLGKSRPELNE